MPLKQPDSESEDEAQHEVVSSSEVPKDDKPEPARASSELSSSKPLDDNAVNDKPHFTTEPEVETLRDAGSGKVRGANGRFQPKGKPAKPGRKSKNAAGGRLTPFLTYIDVLLKICSEAYSSEF